MKRPKLFDEKFEKLFRAELQKWLAEDDQLRESFDANKRTEEHFFALMWLRTNLKVMIGAGDDSICAFTKVHASCISQGADPWMVTCKLLELAEACISHQDN